MRTGIEFVLLAVKGDSDQFGRPHVHVSSQRVNDFFGSSMNCSVQDSGVRLEAYCVAGAKGAVSFQRYA